jgi:hypothetical protein
MIGVRCHRCRTRGRDLELRRTAIAIRALQVEAIDARHLFNEVLKPESYADLYDRLAAMIEAEDQE